ncbi:HEAT repeat domain-containing protein [Corallococcus sp. 4LFB]|uniref:HEAT repeat domain-containing protein n=1 Tax=Corallococcus sp. 4LFB TaxID=3383249 RepID=UPI0039748283
MPDGEDRRRIEEKVEAAATDGNASQRQEAGVRGLRALGGERARVKLEAMLADSDTDDDVRRTVAEELGKFGDPAAESALAAALNEEDDDLRAAARKALDVLFPKERTRVEFLAVQSEHEDISEPAATYLASEGDPALLVPRLATLDNAELRLRLRRGLARRGALPVPEVIALFGHDKPEAREEAMQAAKEEAESAKERVREEIRNFRDSFKHQKGKRGARDVVARGQTLEVKEGESVESAVSYGGNLIVKGTVEDDAVAFGGNLEIHGHVEGDAHAFGGNVILGPDARIDGDVSAFGGRVEKAPGARVEGSLESFGGAGLGRMVAGEIKRGMQDVQNHDGPSDDSDGDDDHDSGGGLASFILQFALLFGLGFLGQMFFPARMKELGDEIRANPRRNAFVGFVGALALIPLTVVLCVTLVGIPVAFALLVASMVGTALGYAAIASELGTRLPVLRGRKTQAVVLALGLGLILLVSHIPVLGFLLNLFLIPLAFGSVIRTRFGYRGGRGMPEPIFPRNEHPV